MILYRIKYCVIRFVGEKYLTHYSDIMNLPMSVIDIGIYR